MTRSTVLPSVSVVVPHKGRPEALRDCLFSVREQTYARVHTEIVIVINDQESEGLPFSLEDNERVLYEPHHGSYAARNMGINATTGDIVAFIDSDAIADPNWLAAGVNAITNGADLVAGHINVTTSTTATTAPGRYEKLFAFDQEKNARAGYSATANLFASRETIDSVGLFDQTARTGEDFEWTRAASDSGFTLTYSPAAIVSHPARETWPQLFAKARRTTSLFAGVSAGKAGAASRLRQRMRHQLGTAPSPARLSATTVGDRVAARAVHLALVGYKSLCLMGLAPKFRGELAHYARTIPRASATKVGG